MSYEYTEFTIDYSKIEFPDNSGINGIIKIPLSLGFEIEYGEDHFNHEWFVKLKSKDGHISKFIFSMWIKIEKLKKIMIEKCTSLYLMNNYENYKLLTQGELFL